MTIKSWASLGATAAIGAAVALWPVHIANAQQASPSAAMSGATGLVNDVQMLKEQNRQLLGQIEQLQHQVEQLRQINKEQYIALDARIKKLESGPATDSGKSTKTEASAASTGKAIPVAPAPAVSSGPAGASSTAATGNVDVDDPAVQDAYAKAFDALRAGQFDVAQNGFLTFVQKYPATQLTPNALYWLGESYYVTQDYQHALAAFEQVIKNFPDSGKAPGALLKKGYSEYALHQTDAAAATLQQVVQQYPDSSVAKLAAQRLQDIQLQQQLQ